MCFHVFQTINIMQKVHRGLVGPNSLLRLATSGGNDSLIGPNEIEAELEGELDSETSGR